MSYITTNIILNINSNSNGSFGLRSLSMQSLRVMEHYDCTLFPFLLDKIFIRLRGKLLMYSYTTY